MITKCPQRQQTTLDLFKKQALLISSDNASNQKIRPSYSPDDPMLEFEFLGDRKNFIEFKKILEIK